MKNTNESSFYNKDIEFATWESCPSMARSVSCKWFAFVTNIQIYFWVIPGTVPSYATVMLQLNALYR